MEQITVGTNVQFESFSKPKTQITGVVAKIFTSKKDNKQYCQVKVEGKLISKQLSKVTVLQA
jgi:hypothetical protein